MQQCGSVQFEVSDFGFEMQDLSNLRFLLSSVLASHQNVHRTPSLAIRGLTVVKTCP